MSALGSRALLDEIRALIAHEGPMTVERYMGLALGHPNFVEVLAVSATKGITFVVMEHVEHGQKLERIIRDRTPISSDRALLIVNQLAEVLRFGRERGVVVAKHKRTNILVDKRG